MSKIEKTPDVYRKPENKSDFMEWLKISNHWEGQQKKEMERTFAELQKAAEKAYV